MEFAPHLLRILAGVRQGGVDVVYHPPLKVSDFVSRKELARAAEEIVRSGLDAAIMP
jgi:1-acyl-sn-glycerol-3-phosphate acyltransferase